MPRHTRMRSFRRRDRAPRYPAAVLSCLLDIKICKKRAYRHPLQKNPVAAHRPAKARPRSRAAEAQKLAPENDSGDLPEEAVVFVRSWSSDFSATYSLAFSSLIKT